MSEAKISGHTIRYKDKYYVLTSSDPIKVIALSEEDNKYVVLDNLEEDQIPKEVLEAARKITAGDIKRLVKESIRRLNKLYRAL